MNASPTRAFTLPHSERSAARDATEQRILDATRELLQQGESLAGLSVTRIVKAAGVSRATFYLHFSDKRALIARLAELRLNEFGEITDPFVGRTDAGRDELEQVVRALIESWRRQAGVLSGLIELAEYDDAAREAWRASVLGTGEVIAKGVRTFRADLTHAQTEALGELIAWMGERVCHQMVGTRSTDARADRAAEALTEAVWRIISP